MAKIIPLDRYIKEGVTYESGKRVAYIIRKIGTDSATDAYLEIEEKPTGIIDSQVAPLHKTSSNVLGPLDLGDLYYVIPPETKFKVVGASGCKMRLIGEIVQLEATERLPSPYPERYARQFDHYVTKVENTLTLATDEVFGADEEKTVVTVKPSTIETYKFNNFIGVAVSGGTVTEGDFAIVFYYDNKPFEYLKTSGFGPGIDVKSLPLPPSDTVEELAYTLAASPITVEPEHEFVIKVRNISGSNKAPASGSAWSFNIKALVEYLRR